MEGGLKGLRYSNSSHWALWLGARNECCGVPQGRDPGEDGEDGGEDMSSDTGVHMHRMQSGISGREIHKRQWRHHADRPDQGGLSARQLINCEECHLERRDTHILVFG
ncbi:hypothetical protein BaRGS_00024184 [Batillaria attramentaria]|uniref:Uncharacterized protein n=1 Tax=Batillaria attramentaria TaxID=370345 RepID=A0ABD0KC71_9CAEN